VVESPHSVAETALDPHETVSIEDGKGRILSGSGVPEDQLAEGLRVPAPALEGQPENDPKPSRTQKRITQLTSKADQAEAARLAAEQKNQELSTRLALLEQRELERSLPAPENPPVSQGRPKPQVAEVGTKYPDYESYVEALADWKAEQREAKLREDFDARFEQRLEAERASRTQKTVMDQVVARGEAAYPDFRAVVGASTVDFPLDMLKAIVSLPHAEHVEYALAKDPDLAQRIAQIPDGLTLGLELAKLMPSGARVTPASQPPGVRISQAPPPVEPVGAGSRTASPSLADLADSGNFAAYKAARAAQMGGTRR
jgi:hypothetical protein